MRKKAKTVDLAALLDALNELSEPVTGCRRTLVGQGWSPHVAEMLAANALANIINTTFGKSK